MFELAPAAITEVTDPQVKLHLVNPTALDIAQMQITQMFADKYRKSFRKSRVILPDR